MSRSPGEVSTVQAVRTRRDLDPSRPARGSTAPSLGLRTSITPRLHSKTSLFLAIFLRRKLFFYFFPPFNLFFRTQGRGNGWVKQTMHPIPRLHQQAGKKW